MRKKRVALVLAGGAARGAYEVGIVVHVLEEVRKTLGHEIRLDILCGTSVGALNACGLAAHADLAPSDRVKRLVDVWTGLEIEKLVRTDVTGVLKLGARILGRAVPAAEMPAREGGLIDPSGLEELVEKSIPFERIHGNIERNYLEALTVSTTHIGSGKTVVFVERKEPGLPRWSHDPTIEPRAQWIGAKHALASAAIPILFRAVALDGEFHCDGGLRQNVPLSPARRLGADGVLIVNPRFLPTTPLGSDDPVVEDIFPGPLFLLGKTLNALLLDRIDTDLARLETINRILDAGTRSYGASFIATLNESLGYGPGQGLRTMRSMLVRASRDIGQLAAEYVRSSAFSGASGLTGRLIRRLADPDSQNEADLLSYLLFDGKFARILIDLGREDARARHDELSAFFEAMASG